MKTSLIIFFFIVLSKMCFAQQKQSLDYQYYRDDNKYYAFELYKNASLLDDKLMLDFVSNGNYKKIDRIYLKEGGIETKLKFKSREEIIKSDNPEQKFYPIMISSKDLESKKTACEIQIVFKLDNGSILTLPFNICAIFEQLDKS
ncbi:hypothetical protein [Pedobacter aquatilis]|uniref:hypothetical protein n=1 Tax=Pedobacter aquatilis TaxID=351343 RepID=UPI00292F8A25|nr:hypothetical protein [Pedobacter aquatilis]